jgi:Ca2+-binding EF-hand superfamily protein
MTLRPSILVIPVALMLLGGSFATAAPRGNAVKAFDTDADGTLDLAEVKKASAALFARLDRDHDGTLDRSELAGRLTAKQLAAADPDHDGTLTLDEFQAVVEQRFHAADPDADGTVDANELNRPAGRVLLQVMR